MKARLRTVASTALLAAFILACVGINVAREMTPPVPTRRGDDPFNLTINELAAHAVLLEGETVTITAGISNVSFDASTGLLSLVMRDEFHDLAIIVTFSNVTDHDMLRDGSMVTIKAESRVASEGRLVGLDYHVLAPHLVYVTSISGAVFLVIVVLLYFKVDWRRARLVENAKPREKTGNQVNG